MKPRPALRILVQSEKIWREIDVLKPHKNISNEREMRREAF